MRINFDSLQTTVFYLKDKLTQLMPQDSRIALLAAVVIGGFVALWLLSKCCCSTTDHYQALSRTNNYTMHRNVESVSNRVVVNGQVLVNDHYTRSW